MELSRTGPHELAPRPRHAGDKSNPLRQRGRWRSGAALAAALALSCGCTSFPKWGKDGTDGTSSKSSSAAATSNPIALTAPNPDSSGPVATVTLSPTAWTPSPKIAAYSKLPATQMAVSWRHWVDYLPDPARDGKMSPGIAGQLFLFDAELRPALANGTLVLKLYDETVRPPGQQGIAPEMWEFNKETLKKLPSVDERFGRFYVLFLPLPTYRPDVTQVRITARYVEDGNTLYAQEANFALSSSPLQDASSGWKHETLSDVEARQRLLSATAASSPSQGLGMGFGASSPPLGVIGSQFNGVPAANRQTSSMSNAIPYSGAPLTIVPNGGMTGQMQFAGPNGQQMQGFTAGR